MNYRIRVTNFTTAFAEPLFPSARWEGVDCGTGLRFMFILDAFFHPSPGCPACARIWWLVRRRVRACRRPFVEQLTFKKKSPPRLNSFKLDSLRMRRTLFLFTVTPQTLLYVKSLRRSCLSATSTASARGNSISKIASLCTELMPRDSMGTFFSFRVAVGASRSQTTIGTAVSRTPTKNTGNGRTKYQS